MRYLDRHALAMLMEYERLAGASQELRAARSAEVEQWLTTAYDRASEAGRSAFVELVNESGGEWPWSAVAPLQVDLAALDDDLARAIDRGPPALLLVVLQDTTETEFTDPDNWIGDGDEWIPLRDALLSWSPEAIESFMRKGIWSPSTVKVDANEPQGSDAGNGGEAPSGDEEPKEDGGGVFTPPPAPGSGSSPASSVWKSWQLWTAVGVAAVATYGLTRIRRG